MLLYSLLHLTGYELPLEEIKNFRQWDSLTPGHPEYGLTPGVGATTGPLGQVLPMVWAWQWLRLIWRRFTIDRATRSSTITPMALLRMVT